MHSLETHSAKNGIIAPEPLMSAACGQGRNNRVGMVGKVQGAPEPSGPQCVMQK